MSLVWTDTSIEKVAKHRLRPMRKAHRDRTDFKPAEPGCTVAAVAALRDADVVFYDRLAPYQDLRSLTAAGLVDVGKKPGHHKVSQADIEKLMVESALAGNNVVRLKGGDPYVFGRGGEEVASCVGAGVPVRVVSGVTSAIPVPAAAGIPVTHREVSHIFTVVSGHAPASGPPSPNWATWPRP